MNWTGPKNSGAKSEEFSVFGREYLGPAPGYPLLDEILATCLTSPRYHNNMFDDILLFRKLYTSAKICI